jgi:hypothetical protein
VIFGEWLEMRFEMDVSCVGPELTVRPWWLKPFEEWTAADLRPEYVAEVLDGILRFCNRSPLLWNLTRHQLLVEMIMPATATRQQRLYALTHDVHEMFSGEVPRDAKENFRLAIEDYQDRVDRHILPLLGVDVDAGRAGGVVAECDRQAAEMEIHWSQRFLTTRSINSLPANAFNLFEGCRNSETQWLERYLELRGFRE